MSIQSKTGSAIRGLYFDKVKHLLFSAGYDQGEIAIYEVGKVGKEKHANLNGSLVGKPKIREIVWSNKRGEVMVGNEDGTISIWSASKQASICKTPLLRHL